MSTNNVQRCYMIWQVLLDINTFVDKLLWNTCVRIELEVLSVNCQATKKPHMTNEAHLTGLLYGRGKRSEIGAFSHLHYVCMYNKDKWNSENWSFFMSWWYISHSHIKLICEQLLGWWRIVLICWRRQFHDYAAVEFSRHHTTTLPLWNRSNRPRARLADWQHHVPEGGLFRKQFIGGRALFRQMSLLLCL